MDLALRDDRLCRQLCWGLWRIPLRPIQHIFLKSFQVILEVARLVNGRLKLANCFQV